MDQEGKWLWMPWKQKRKTHDSHGISPEYNEPLQQESNPQTKQAPSFVSIVTAALFTRRRLQIKPHKHLHFLYEPGKQVSSAFAVKNTSRSFVAFKLLTNSPKSCFMRSPTCVLSPGETVLVTVVKFIEQPDSKEGKIKQLFRVVSLKVEQGMEYSLELFEEQKQFVAVEKNLQVMYLDPQTKSPDIEKLKKRLAEAEAVYQSLKRSAGGKIQMTGAAAPGPEKRETESAVR